MMNARRLEMEKQVLAKHLPANTYRFVGLNSATPYLLMAAMTNSGHVYTLKIYLDEFPFRVPKVLVMNDIRTKDNRKMSQPSASMHVLGTYEKHVQICHYGEQSWTPSVSLYLVFIKCRLWLEMYEEHLKTGKPIDYYLKHQD